MKLFSIALLLLLSLPQVFAQVDSFDLPEMSDYQITKTVLADIDRSRDSANLQLQSKIQELEQRMLLLDDNILQNASVNTRISSVVERLNTVEAIQLANQSNEVATYQSNYQTALINLVSMERELQPLYLFRSTKEFYSALGDVGNLSTYEGFGKWWSGFKGHVEKEKGDSPVMALVSTALSIGSTFITGGVLNGPVVQAVIMGITQYIGGLGRREDGLKRQSTEMMGLITVVSQFNHDKSIVDSEWGVITTELEELSKLYEVALKRNLSLINLDETTFRYRFANEVDPARRLVFLNELSGIAHARVSEDYKGAKEWKDKFHYEMMAIQALRLRYGQSTMRIAEHLKRYEKLIEQYQTNPIVGTRVSAILPKLKQLQDIFSVTFSPADYIQSATTMYKVN